MNPALTREYAERTLESKISLFRRIKIKLKRRKDSGAYQSFFSEVFYSGYRFLDEISCSFAVSGDFFSGFSVSNRPLRLPSLNNVTV